MNYGKEKLTVKPLRELWEEEFLSTIKSEIEAVKVQIQSQIATVNERLQNIEQNQSSLSFKYDNLLVADSQASSLHSLAELVPFIASVTNFAASY